MKAALLFPLSSAFIPFIIVRFVIRHLIPTFVRKYCKKMKIRQTVILLFLSLSFLSCKNDKNTSLEKFFSKLSIGVELHPDSVLHVLDSVKPVAQFNEINMARWNLLYTRAIEENTLELPVDSIVLCATDVLCMEGGLKEQAYSYFYLGRLHDDKDESDEALEAYLQALDKAKEAKEYRLAGLIGRYIANIYNSMNLYDKAIDMLKHSDAFFEKLGNGCTRIFTIMEIGKYFIFKDMVDSALVYYSKAESLSLQINDKDVLSRLYHQLGVIQSDYLGDYQIAEYYLKRALVSQNDSDLIARVHLALGFVYTKQKLYDKAKDYFDQSLTYKNNMSLKTKATIYLGLKNVEYALKNYKVAVDWADKYHNLSDSITSFHLEANAIKAERDYKARKLLYENNKLQKEQHNNTSIIGILIFIVLTGTCIYQRIIIYKNKNIRLQQEEMTEMKKKVLQGNEVTQKINLLSQVPSHKRKSLEEKLEELFNNGSKIKVADWKELEEIINETQNDFVSKLRIKFPKLSEKDIHFILLIRMGLDTYRLSNIFDIAKKSTWTKRYRIRKKLGLKEKENLDLYVKRLFN